MTLIIGVKCWKLLENRWQIAFQGVYGGKTTGKYRPPEAIQLYPEQLIFVLEQNARLQSERSSP